MSRVKISVGILAGLLLLCIGSLMILHAECMHYAALTDNVSQAVENGNTEQALAALEDLEKEWEHFHRVAGLFVDGEKLDPMREILSGLRPLISQEHAEVPAELRRLRNLTVSIYEEEVPVVWHIL